MTNADSPEELRRGLELLGLPGDYEAAVRGHRDALNVYRMSNRLWTYFSPAGSIYAGERTGRFRLGGDQLLVDANGRSRISFEDAAVALIDEAELPRHIQRRFTVTFAFSVEFFFGLLTRSNTPALESKSDRAYRAAK